MIQTIEFEILIHQPFDFVIYEDDEELKEFFNKRVEISYTHWGAYRIEDVSNSSNYVYVNKKDVKIKKIDKFFHPEYYL